MRVRGTIVKSSGGFYDVETAESRVSCRARGLFRKDGFKPCVGDNVEISLNEDGSGNVDEVLERKNSLIRPPLANLDTVVVVLSVSDPAPNLAVADRLIAILEFKGIEPVIAVTKSDLDSAEAERLAELYKNAGFLSVCVSIESGDNISELKAALKGGLSAFSGNSGVGKSSLLNVIDSRLGLETGETSKKLGRGRHTTRTTEMFTLDNGGRVADTPGFSTVDVVVMSEIDKQTLPDCFREFARYTGGCRFDDCAHVAETGCAVLAAVNSGEIAQSRHQSYLQLHEQVKAIKEWERKD